MRTEPLHDLLNVLRPFLKVRFALREFGKPPVDCLPGRKISQDSKLTFVSHLKGEIVQAEIPSAVRLMDIPLIDSEPAIVHATELQGAKPALYVLKHLARLNENVRSDIRSFG